MDLHLNSTHLWALGIGLVIGLFFFFMALRAYWSVTREFRRYKKMLADKMELEHRQLNELTKEREKFLKENENLRLQVARLNDRTDNKVARELEIYARAEKQMNISAPGFAPAWEIAKSQALTQLENEERGNSFPQRIFRKLVGGSNPSAALPAEAVANAKNSSNGQSFEVHD